MRKNEGFTVVEILTAIGMYAIAVVFMFSFFAANMKSCKKINTEAELQFQSQYILNFMSNKILESSCVELAKNGYFQYFDSTGELPVTKIAVRYGESYQCYIFEIRNQKIFYGNGYATSGANIELGVYINNMNITPLPLGKNFEEARAVRIKLFLEKDSQNYEAEQVVCMRNNINN